MEKTKTTNRGGALGVRVARCELRVPGHTRVLAHAQDRNRSGAQACSDAEGK